MARNVLQQGVWNAVREKGWQTRARLLKPSHLSWRVGGLPPRISVGIPPSGGYHSKSFIDRLMCMPTRPRRTLACHLGEECAIAEQRLTIHSPFVFISHMLLGFFLPSQPRLSY